MINVDNLCFGYDEDLFTGVKFNLKVGDTLAILGPNGVGKTTLLKCLLGFLTPRTGSIDIVNSRENFWKTVGYVPQARMFNFPFTVRDIVLMGRASFIPIGHSPGKKDMEITDEILDWIGIKHLGTRSINSVSGGQLQLALIARALVKEPKLLILDEPESNLDMKNQLLILGILEKFKEKGITMIINTHYPDHALRISDKTLLLGGAEKWLLGDSSKTICEENIREYFHILSRIIEVKTDKKSYKRIIPMELIKEGII